MPKVSVIIPCFNDGQYVREALDSALAQTFPDFEVIIVNDGSTDEQTNRTLNDLDSAKVRLITTENQGLAAARNNGISRSGAPYILPLDADDKIAPTYLEKAVRVLDENPRTGIVYCRAEFFGDEGFPWDLPDFELPRMLVDNLIFCSAFFRREDWETVGGFRSEMKYGWEDYDFWLSIIQLGREVRRIPEYLFYYRRRSDSMANRMSRENLLYSYKEIVKKHPQLYLDNIEALFEHLYALRDEVSGLRQERILKDTRIHHLNLEIGGLNAKISDLDAQLSSGRALLRRLFRLIAGKTPFTRSVVAVDEDLKK